MDGNERKWTNLVANRPQWLGYAVDCAPVEMFGWGHNFKRDPSGVGGERPMLMGPILLKTAGCSAHFQNGTARKPDSSVCVCVCVCARARARMFVCVCESITTPKKKRTAQLEIQRGMRDAAAINLS
jgi:hypothetical protein